MLREKSSCTLAQRECKPKKYSRLILHQILYAPLPYKKLISNSLTQRIKLTMMCCLLCCSLCCLLCCSLLAHKHDVWRKQPQNVINSAATPPLSISGYAARAFSPYQFQKNLTVKVQVGNDPPCDSHPRKSRQFVSTRVRIPSLTSCRIAVVGQCTTTGTSTKSLAALSRIRHSLDQIS